LGPIGIAFDGGGRMYVAAGDLYRFGPEGGAADASHRINQSRLAGTPAGLAFGKDGTLYAVRRTGRSLGDIVQLDPRDGAIVRQVVAGLACPTGLAVDPRSGDLFVSSVGCAAEVVRITGSRVRPYMTGVFADGLAFARNGTLYVAHQPDRAGDTVSAVAGTGSATPGARTGLANVPRADGIAASQAVGSDGGPAFLVVNRIDGKISAVDLTTDAHPVSDLMTGGSRGDFVAAGPDGCLYATQTSEILRVSGSDGTCTAAGTALEPSGVRIIPPSAAFVQISGGSVRAATCRTNRRLKVRFRAPGGVKVRSARIFVKGHYNRKVSGRALRRSVTVRRLPVARFRLTIRATTQSGRRIVVRRKYGACAGR
jgi:hypothetical protein